MGEASHPGPVCTRAAAGRHAEDADAAEAVLRSEAWRAGGASLATRAAFRCSALTVPLVWAAARGDADHEVLQRLCDLAPSAAEAARRGFAALGRVLRAEGVSGQDDLAELLSARAGVGQVVAGARFEHSGQRWLLDYTTERDVEVANLEAAYDAAVQELARTQARPPAGPPAPPPRTAAAASSQAPAEATPLAAPRAHTAEELHLSPGDNPGASARRRRLTLVRTRGWEALDSIVLADEFRVQVRCVQGVPAFLRGQLRGAFRTSLARLREAYGHQDEPNKVRSWKLFRLTSRMLLWRSHARSPSREELEKRLERFHNQEWLTLIREAREAGSADRRPRRRRISEAEELELRALRAEKAVRRAEVSTGRQALCSAALAPGNAETLRELRDPERRPPCSTRPLPAEALAFTPPRPPAFDEERYVSNVRSARRGAAGGLAGDTNEHLKILLDAEEDTDLLVFAGQKLAVGDVPAEIVDALRLGGLTALAKGEGRVRGIVAGDTFRRGVARTLAQQHAEDFEDACMPFQYALSTKAGTDCVSRIVRVLTELDARKTLVSIDGVGAFDHITRASMLSALHANESLRSLLPFVRLFYAQQSEYVWYDDEGKAHSVVQGEGGEQGDPLMPALYALGQHAALQEVSDSLGEGELIFAYLDDVYVLCDPERVAEIFLLVAEALRRHAGVEVNLGKTKVWNAAGEKPRGADTMGREAWVGECEVHKRGVVVLGAPVGHPSFVAKWLQDKAEEHAVFLDRIPAVKDPQCAWSLLRLCAGPRASHVVRNLPPSQTEAFAQLHDQRLRECLSQIAATDLEGRVAREITQLPFRHGGLSLRSAVRGAPAAYWASWADSLSQIQARNVFVCDTLMTELHKGVASGSASVREAAEAAELLSHEGFDVPAWDNFRDPEFKPPQPENAEPGEWKHGWQFHASAARDSHFAASAHLPLLSPPLRCLRTSQCGPCASRHFTVLPSAKDTTFTPERFRTLLLVRLRRPLGLVGRRCRCGVVLDPFGDHRSACARVGLLGPRGAPAEVMAARVCREGGARVRENQFLRDLNVAVPAGDTRKIEVIANGLPFWGGIQVAVDTTVVSALTGAGLPRSQRPGKALLDAKRDKERTYPELVAGEPPHAEAQVGRCRLLVMAFEVGGRWSQETVDFLWLLAEYRARSSPRLLRRSAQLLFYQRWIGLLACAVQGAYAASLLEEPLARAACVSGTPVHLSEMDRPF